MPVSNSVFTRIWKFVTQFSDGDTIDRADIDTALDDVAVGINAALASSQGPVYSTTTTGLAAVSEGEYFWVADATSATGTLSLYRDVSGVATLQLSLSKDEDVDPVITDPALLSLLALSGQNNRIPFFTSASTLDLLEISNFGKTLIDDADAAAVLTTLGISAFVQTLLDDADAAAVLTTLGISAFAQTFLDDADAAAVLTTLGLALLTNAQAQGTSNTVEGLISGTVLNAAIDARMAPFVSSEQSVTSGGSLTIAHGLGYTPQIVTGVLVFTSAANGYAIGDEVPIAPNAKADGTNHFGFTCVPDGTNLNIRFANGTDVFTIINKTTGADENVAPSNVDIKFVAWGRE